MNIEETNCLYIKSNFNGRIDSGSQVNSSINYDLLTSVMNHRRIHGVISNEDLRKHHESTIKYVRTVNCN